MIGKLIRYFHLTKEYCLEYVTLHDWSDIYNRELKRCPPADEYIASYFGHHTEEVEESEEYVSDLPEYEA